MVCGSLIVIRLERPDHPQVLALLTALDAYLTSLYPPDANHILDVQALFAPEVDFLVAWQGAEALGCGAVRRMPAESETRGEGYGEVKRMYVRPEARGRRIAEQMLSELEALLRRAGIGQALLETGGRQKEAVRLYERSGYAPRGPFGGYLDNGLSLFYEKRLER